MCERMHEYLFSRSCLRGEMGHCAVPVRIPPTGPSSNSGRCLSHPPPSAVPEHLAMALKRTPTCCRVRPAPSSRRGRRLPWVLRCFAAFFRVCAVCPRPNTYCSGQRSEGSLRPCSPLPKRNFSPVSAKRRSSGTRGVVSASRSTGIQGDGCKRQP